MISIGLFRKYIVNFYFITGVMLILWWVLGRNLGLISWLVISAIFSLALEPLVNYLENKGWKRGLATFAGMTLGIGLIMVIVIGVIPILISQARSIIDKLPDTIVTIQDFLDKHFDYNLDLNQLVTEAEGLNINLRSYAGSITTSAVDLVSQMLSSIFQFLTIYMFTFYLTAEAPKLRRFILKFLPSARRKTLLEIWEIAIDKTGGYFYSRILLGSISAICALVVFILVGLDFALPLAIWLGFISQFIPSIGTYLAAILPIIVAVVSGNPVTMIVVVVYIILYQQLENYYISPKITAKTMELHPMIAFISAIIGNSIAGPMGAFLALPVAGVIQESISQYLKRHHQAKAGD
ncbi:AI-2E family transporter [Candidatus Nomurabacteria bacterium]|nr:AI-2E family transporter [Candidatus Nomurabacteria bacterium]